MCQCGNKSNCGCTPEDYTSGIVYDGLSFSCPELAGIKPNCGNLNDLLEAVGDLLCKTVSGRKVIPMGAWDIPTLLNHNRIHGLSSSEYASITDVSAIITNDGDTKKIPVGVSSDSSSNSNGRIEVDSVGVTITVNAGETFDNATYSNAVQNRGYIIINYTKG